MSFIKHEEFTKEELEAGVKQLAEMQTNEAAVDEAVRKIFQEYDLDKNGVLDRRELRQFLHKFFSEYKVHFPLTDEYVDAVFVQIDLNRDNKIQPQELKLYAIQ